MSRLYIGEMAVSELVGRLGSPLYVYDEQRIRANVQRVFKAFRSRCDNFELYYAIKSNSNLAIAAILVSEGCGLDTASINEIELANKLGVTGEQVLFTGNYLSDEDLQAASQADAIINLDDAALFPRLAKIKVPETICFRINPAIGKSNVGEEDVLAGVQAKFGIPFEQTAVAYKMARDAGVKKFGVHMMTGSCVTDPSYFEEITTRLMDIVGKTANELGIEFDFVNLGGGLGIPYEPDEAELDIDKTASLVVSAFKNKCSEYSLQPPRLMMEPGRYLVGDAGFLLGKVHAIKESYRRFVGTDIGFNSLMRPTLYNAYHHICVDGKAGNEVLQNITGQLCENTDVWCVDRKLPELELGDLLMVEKVGAYGFCMSYPYNGRLQPAEVLVNGKQYEVIRKRQTVDDLCANIQVPDRLKLK